MALRGRHGGHVFEPESYDLTNDVETFGHLWHKTERCRNCYQN